MRLLLFILILITSKNSNAQGLLSNLVLNKPKIVDNYTFKYTGHIQEYVIPNKVTSIQVNAAGLGHQNQIPTV